MKAHRIVAVSAFVVAALALAWRPAGRELRAAALLLDLSGEHAATPAPSATQRHELIEEAFVIAGRKGPIRARVYRLPGAPPGRGLVVSHGVHYLGIDEPRLMRFARGLARAGVVVVTPELRDLMRYRITSEGVGVIADTARWLARSTLVGDDHVGLLGFSFAGGLGLCAASEPELRGRLAFAASVGGHHDLARVLRFFATNRVEAPDGSRPMQAHEYGLVVAAYGHIDELVPQDDRDLATATLEAWLHEDRPRARALATERHGIEAERLLDLVESGRASELAPAVERIVAAHREELAALSPAGRLASIGAPVYLLHGAADSVIPAAELLWAERELASLPHRALVSPLLEHVEVSHGARFADELALVDFMAQLL